MRHCTARGTGRKWRRIQPSREDNNTIRSDQILYDPIRSCPIRSDAVRSDCEAVWSGPQFGEEMAPYKIKPAVWNKTMAAAILTSYQGPLLIPLPASNWTEEARCAPAPDLPPGGGQCGGRWEQGLHLCSCCK